MNKEKIQRQIKICKNFIKTEVDEIGLTGVVVGVSGGVDSAVTVALATHALGKEKVLGVFMPSKTTSQEDYDDVNKLQNKFKFELVTKPINKITDTFFETILDKKEINPKELAIANVYPRIRMTILYYFANKKNRLVLGTSNKTEILIGYGTKYGDLATDINPIGDLYKKQIRAIAKELSIPSSIIQKPPSAGLWVNQTDEEEIGMSYELLDKILSRLEVFENPKDIAAQLDIPVNEVHRIKNMIKTAEHKSRSPKILKLGFRTPGTDWRIPRI